MKEYDIVTLGELLIDMFPEQIGHRMGEVEAFTPKPGGAPANVAVAASRLGMQSAFIGKVGQDLFGEYLIGVLEREGVETRGIRTDEYARTTMAIIAMPDKNSAEFVFYRNPGADQRLKAEELDENLLNHTKCLHFGSLSLSDEPAREATYQAALIARRSGALVSFDVNYRPTLWSSPAEALKQTLRMIPEVDLVKVNEIEAALLTEMSDLDPSDHDQLETAARKILGLGPSLVVITLGAEGSYFQIQSSGAYVAPFRVDTVDAVGCGDAFVAGLLRGMVSSGDWQKELDLDRMTEHLRFANAVGALTSLKRGAIPAMPSLADVESFIDKNK